jgi:hypothetical protein
MKPIGLPGRWAAAWPVFLFQLGDLLFKGHSAELAQNLSYFLITMTISFGLFCAYASFKTRSIKSKIAKDLDARKSKR